MFEGDVRHMAEWHLKDKGLVEKGWTLTYARNGKYLLGQCRPRRKQIYINLTYTDHSTEDQVRDLILHEIAHALEYERYGTSGHGPRWKMIASEVGATPTACASNSHLKTGLVGFCPNPFCEYETWKFTRRPRRNYVCPDCRLSLEWEHTGQ